ncbi:MAG TPA: phosphatidylserine decarboxylase [Candidatus Acidoferrales bacterium]
MVKEGYKFAAGPIVLGVAALFLGWHILALQIAAFVLLALGTFILYFFRDPERVIPSDTSTIVSPADGRVLEVIDEKFDGRAGKRITIFLAVWNVHVNRTPLAGKIARIEYRPGKFQMAMRKTASAENEQNVIYLDTAHGQIVFKQIAGMIARRVVLWRKAGDQVERGERIGIVRFGSRMDVWLPFEAAITVKPGDHVAGGSSILARWI